MTIQLRVGGSFFLFVNLRFYVLQIEMMLLKALHQKKQV